MAWCFRSFGACVPAAALKLKAAQAAFSKRALWVACAPVRSACVLCRFASSPQPALVRVAARGQPSGHLASGGVADAAEEAARAVAEEVERTVERGVLVDRCEDGLVRGALSARARPRRPLD